MPLLIFVGTKYSLSKRETLLESGAYAFFVIQERRTLLERGLYNFCSSKEGALLGEGGLLERGV